jgi:late competence protein required for DNA uptake (superfamily II DNA/RNA helicase)
MSKKHTSPWAKLFPHFSGKKVGLKRCEKAIQLFVEIGSSHIYCSHCSAIGEERNQLQVEAFTLHTDI